MSITQGKNAKHGLCFLYKMEPSIHKESARRASADRVQRLTMINNGILQVKQPRGPVSLCLLH